METTTFIATVAPLAIAAQKSRNILASLSIAQAICESGWGEHTYGANNLFGIKANGWTGKTVTIKTAEEDKDGNRYYITAAFRAYDSWAESIADHAAFLVENSRYANIIGNADYKSVCTLIKPDGYATESTYTTQLISIIEQHELYKYDVLPALLTIDSVTSATVKGWALNSAGVAHVDVYVDNNVGLGSSKAFSTRKDVATVYPNYSNAATCGYCVKVKLGKGIHTLKVAAVGKDNSVKWVTKKVIVK